MNLGPDNVVYWSLGWFKLNQTILMTWIVMIVLTAVSRFCVRGLSSTAAAGRRQVAIEAVVATIKRQIEEIGLRDAERYLPFLGTLFLFVAAANILAVVPGYHPPTGSLSTTAALALTVFVAVPCYGVRQLGLRGYLGRYVRPVFLLLPINIVAELSRTLALAVRLFGNIMSGDLIVGILLGVAPLFFPVLMQVLGLLTGTIQAYIFAVLAAVYIAAGTGASEI